MQHVLPALHYDGYLGISACFWMKQGLSIGVSNSMKTLLQLQEDTARELVIIIFDCSTMRTSFSCLCNRSS
jgi:hypothetical protein